MSSMTPAQKPTFASAEDAWLWAMAHRHTEMARSVFDTLDHAYRRRRLDLYHARVLRIWGEIGFPPPSDNAERPAWDEAMEALKWPLCHAGIIR